MGMTNFVILKKQKRHLQGYLLQAASEAEGLCPSVAITLGSFGIGHLPLEEN